MARATDRAGIQFRVLNLRKGRPCAPPVPRRIASYKAAIRSILENQPNLSIFQQAVDDLIVEGDTVKGVVTRWGEILSPQRGAYGGHLWAAKFI